MKGFDWRTLRRRPVLVIGALVIASIAVAAFIWGGQAQTRLENKAADRAIAQAAKSAVVALPPPDLYRPLTPEEALAENQKRAPVARPDSPAAPFKPRFADNDSRARALECMTQAIYYEAASEPLEGRQAVAQVVINRMRNPGFPNSICGVVYQGSDRTTGCQFTFTCDGSLRRPPATMLWNQARKVAAQALAGKVYGAVGHATHYHADYVLPYWADSLDKEVQVGRHIFYRLKGVLGAPRAFSQRYAGREPAPLSATDIEVAASAIENVPADPGADLAGLVPPPPEAPKPPPILADVSHGQLLADDHKTGMTDTLASALAGPPDAPTAKAPARPSNDCPRVSAGDATKARPLDNRAGRQSLGDCR